MYKRTITAAVSAAGILAAVLGQQTHASAAVAARSTVTARAVAAIPAADPPTTVTFTVTTGALNITVPVSADLGSAAPGGAITGPIGIVTVTDNRAALGASWSATASSTDFTTGAGTGPETIPASIITYTPGTVTPTGTVTIGSSTITLTGAAQQVVNGTGINGDNTAAWNPTLNLTVPPSAVGGVYTGTLSHSVS